MFIFVEHYLEHFVEHFMEHFGRSIFPQIIHCNQLKNNDIRFALSLQIKASNKWRFGVRMPTTLNMFTTAIVHFLFLGLSGSIKF